ncbi:hypothetical protein [Spiribacter pallidus]|jgi:hypothetical protein|uniref:DUF429 domain-containing protein n=1 Tax=Spiribacter pallidus TaxID=1987936 RepID=A0ABV3T9C9_9GAMM
MRRRNFSRTIGIDYSGAATPEKGLTGLRVYCAGIDGAPQEIRPFDDPRRHWSRRSLAAWLAQTLQTPEPTLVGIDHGFGFPRAWFQAHDVAPDWEAFLADLPADYPTDQAGVSVEAVRRGRIGHGARRPGNARWRRAAEERVGAKSVFHFDVPGSVAKSTHAGLPWLARLRHTPGLNLHIWPFDGWQIPPGCSAVAEIYPSLWSANYPRGSRTPDQHDAYVVAAGLAAADGNGELGALLQPSLDTTTRQRAQLEGWILGVG